MSAVQRASEDGQQKVPELPLGTKRERLPGSQAVQSAASLVGAFNVPKSILNSSNFGTGQNYIRGKMKPRRPAPTDGPAGKPEDDDDGRDPSELLAFINELDANKTNGVIPVWRSQMIQAAADADSLRRASPSPTPMPMQPKSLTELLAGMSTDQSSNTAQEKAKPPSLGNMTDGDVRSSGGPRSRLAAALPALAPASPQRNFYAGLSSSSRQAYSSGPPSGPLPTAGPKSGQLNPLQSLESLESDVQDGRRSCNGLERRLWEDRPSRSHNGAARTTELPVVGSPTKLSCNGAAPTRPSLSGSFRGSSQWALTDTPQSSSGWPVPASNNNPRSSRTSLSGASTPISTQGVVNETSSNSGRLRLLPEITVPANVGSPPSQSRMLQSPLRQLRPMPLSQLSSQLQSSNGVAQSSPAGDSDWSSGSPLPYSAARMSSSGLTVSPNGPASSDGRMASKSRML